VKDVRYPEWPVLSVNPVAFKRLREQAYTFAAQHGRDREGLHRYCLEQVHEWRRTDPEGGDLSEEAGERLACDVAKWVAEKYRPKKKRPKSTREERAIDQATITCWVEDIEAAGERPSVRNVANWSQFSKTRAARLLNAEGIAPRREAEAAKLSANAQRLYRILDWYVPRSGQVAISLAPLMDLIWPPHPVVDTKKSARSMRKQRFRKLVEEIKDVRLGFHIHMFEGVMAVRHGRRWGRPRDIALYIDDEKEWRRIVIPEMPPDRSRTDLFWNQPEIQTCVGLLKISRFRYFYRVEDVMPLVIATRKGLDDAPMIRAVQRTIASGKSPVDYLSDLAGVVLPRNPIVGKRIARFTRGLSELFMARMYGWEAKGVLRTVLDETGYLQRVDSYDKEAGNRIRYLVESVVQYRETCEMTIDRCEKLARDEIANRWRQDRGSEEIIQRMIETIPF